MNVVPQDVKVKYDRSITTCLILLLLVMVVMMVVMVMVMMMSGTGNGNLVYKCVNVDGDTDLATRGVSIEL